MSAPPLLVCEALGFVPQLFLDDIVNVANQTIQNAANDMEVHLLNWVEKCAKQQPEIDKDGTEEVERGLVAFQTLLEHHTDLGFDYFETWSLRNAFNFSADLPMVLPHHEGLDLDAPLDRERELMDEVDSLLKKIDAVCLSWAFAKHCR
jgi:kinetochore protein Mis12/MTW1